jgi:hypothetical protein
MTTQSKRNCDLELVEDEPRKQSRTNEDDAEEIESESKAARQKRWRTAHDWQPARDAHVVCGLNMRGDDLSDIDSPATRLYLVPLKLLTKTEVATINVWRNHAEYPTVEIGYGKPGKAEIAGEAAFSIVNKKGVMINFEDLPNYNLSAAGGSFTFLYSNFYG